MAVNALASVLLVLALFLVLCTVTLPGATAAEKNETNGTTIKILNLYFSPIPLRKVVTDALLDGAQAAFFHAGFRTADKRSIVLINKTREDTGANVTYTITTALERHPDLFAILGPSSDSQLLEAMAIPMVREKHLVCLAPYTGSTRVRKWNPNVFFTRADPRAELIALFTYIANNLLLVRVGLMHLTGGPFHDDDVLLISEMIKKVGSGRRPITYVQPSDSEFNRTAFDKFAAQEPQAIFILGMYNDHTKDFLSACRTSAHTADAIFLSTSDLQKALTVFYYDFAPPGVAFKDRQLTISGTNLLPRNTEFTHIREFARQIKAYHAFIGGGLNFENEEETKHNFTLAEATVNGWIAGSTIMLALNRSDALVSQKAFQEMLFNQNRFVIYEDFVLGDYGGECSKWAMMQGAVCKCNQGGRTVHVKHYLSDDTITENINVCFTYPTTECYPTLDSITPSVNMAIFDIQDNPLLQKASHDFRTLHSILILKDRVRKFRINAKILPANTSTATRVFKQYWEDYFLHFVVGPLPSFALQIPSMIIDPIFSRPRLRVSTRTTYIFFLPTLEQQFYVLMQYLSDGNVTHKVDATDLTAALRSMTPSESKKMGNVLQQTADVFEHTLASVYAMNDSETLTSALAPMGYTLLVGLDDADVRRIADHLQANSRSCVVVSYQDFALHYDMFVSEFNNRSTSVQGRLLTLTNLPLWTDNSRKTRSKSTILNMFFDHVTDRKHHTPVGLWAFVISRIMNQLLSFKIQSYFWVMLFQFRRVTLGEMTFGYYERNCSLQGTILYCSTKNFGARDISLISMERVLNPRVPSDYFPVTPSMSYERPPSREHLSKNTVVGIIVGCIAGVALLVTLAVWLTCYWIGGARNNRNAVKKPEHPVTLVFTDIESSTALWSAMPEIMTTAVATHHKLIREVIAKRQCYEVKTIGDSFMIVCGDAHTAVQAACEMQTKLLRHDWRTPEIDSAYRGFELQRRDESAGYEPPTAMLPAEMYNALWNGLRVRIGIHTGLSDIRYDAVTKGYDYYGETSNMAARTEAIGNGGQILLTESAWWALSHSERACLDVKFLGPQVLRGVPYAVEIYQVNSVPGRRHASLRLEIDAVLPADSAFSATGASVSSASTIAGPAAAVAAVLASCFSSFSLPQRLRNLQPLLQQWHISVPPRNRYTTETDYLQSLMNRLAVRISSLAQMRHQFGGGVEENLPHPAIESSSATLLANLTNVSSRATLRDHSIFIVDNLAEHFNNSYTTLGLPAMVRRELRAKSLRNNAPADNNDEPGRDEGAHDYRQDNARKEHPRNSSVSSIHITLPPSTSLKK